MAQQLSFPREFKNRFTLEELNFFQALIRKVKDLEENPVGLGDFLTALNALTAAADKLPYATGASSAAFADLTSFARTILDDANAAAVLSTLGITAQSTATWQAGTGTTESVVSPAKIAAAITALGGGMLLEDTAVADGTAEHLQVTATSTPVADIKRMIAYFRHVVPEVDAGNSFLTVILDDDTELTSGYENRIILTDGATVTPGTQSTNNVIIGSFGNAAGEYTTVSADLVGDNGSQTVKHVNVGNMQTNSSAVERIFLVGSFISTTQGIKGFRLDTDVAGNMFTAGVAELYVQT